MKRKPLEIDFAIVEDKSLTLLKRHFSDVGAGRAFWHQHEILIRAAIVTGAIEALWNHSEARPLIQDQVLNGGKVSEGLSREFHGAMHNARVTSLWDIIRPIDRRLFACYECKADGYLELAKILLQYGANPNVHAENGWSLMHRCAFEGEWRFALLLLDNGGDINNATGVAEGWLTPLQLAVLAGQREMVEWLLKRGADRRHRNVHGKTAEDIAAEQGERGLAEMINRYMDTQ